jgi:hypothetical protein
MSTPRIISEQRLAAQKCEINIKSVRDKKFAKERRSVDFGVKVRLLWNPAGERRNPQR